MKDKKLSSAKQIFIGVFSVLIFWLFGFFTGKADEWFWDKPLIKFIDKIPAFIFDALPFIFAILVISFALIGKLKNYKKLYWSAFIMTILPCIPNLFTYSGLSEYLEFIYIILFPLWIVLYPFAILGGYTYEALFFNSPLFDYRAEWIFIIIGAGAVISLILFLTVKRKNKNDTTVLTEN